MNSATNALVILSQIDDGRDDAKQTHRTGHAGFRGAHAFCVLVVAFRDDELFLLTRVARKVRESEDGFASRQNACAPQLRSAPLSPAWLRFSTRWKNDHGTIR